MLKKSESKQLNQKVRPSLNTRMFFLLMGDFFLSTIAGTAGAVTDGFIAGQLNGIEELGAISLTAPLFFSMAIIWSLLSKGCQELCADRLGRGEVQEARDILSMALELSVGISILAAAGIILFTDEFTQLVGAAPGHPVFEQARDYMKGAAFGIPAMAVIGLVSFDLQMEGARRWFVYSVAVVCATNLLLDFTLPADRQGNMFTGGLTTSAGYYASVVVIILYYRRKNTQMKPGFVKPSWAAIKRILHGGTSMGVSRITAACKSIYINRLMAVSLTTAGLAAYNVQVQINYVTDALLMGAAEALVLMAEIYFMEENRRGLHQVSRITLRYVVFVALFVTILLTRKPVLQAIVVFYIGEGELESTYEVARCAVLFFGLGLLGQAIAVLLANYLAAIGHTIMSNLVYILDDVVFVIIGVRLCRNFVIREGGGDIVVVGSTFSGTYLAQVLMVLSIPILIIIINRRPAFGWDALLMLPKGFGIPEDNELTATVHNVSEAAAFARKGYDFCIDRNVALRKAFIISLAAEEMSALIIEKGFDDGKSHRLDLRLVCKGEELILSMRDDCRQFDPWEYYDNYSSEGALEEEMDKIAGIHTVMQMATEVSYTAALKLNTLTIRV